MVNAHIALGAELDIASGSEVRAGTDEVLDFLKGRKPVRPSYFVQVGSRSVTAPFTGIVDVGSPATGRLWNVLGYAIVGETDSVQAAAGTAALYIGNPPAAGNAITLSQVRAPRLAVPSSDTFSRQTVWCPSEQSIFFNCVGLTVITQFVANVFIAEYREDEILDRSGR